MSRSQRLKNILEKAKEKEKKYDWVKAADFYEQASGVVGKRDFLKVGEIQEKNGYCFYRAAMQAETTKEFKERMRRAVENYEKAHGLYEKLADEQKAARTFRCRAVARYLDYWLVSDPSEKRSLLDRCLKLEKNALTAFWDLGNVQEYDRTFNELSLVFWHRVFREWDRQIQKRIVEEELQWAEKTVEALSEYSDPYVIPSAYLALAICLHFFGNFVAHPEKLQQNRLRVVEHLRKAFEFSERVGDAYLVGVSHLWLGQYTGGEESMRHNEKALQCGEETRDNMLKARALDFLAFRTYWKAIATEDPDQRWKLAEKAMEFYDEAQHYYSIMSFQSERVGVIALPAGYADHYFHRALLETSLEKKLEFLEKSEKAGRSALIVAEDADIPSIIYTTLHKLSKTLEARARLRSDFDEKKKLLKEALKYRERNIEIIERLTPFRYWDLGVMWNYLADIKAELGYLESDPNSKRRLLEEAVSSKEKCLNLIAKRAPYAEKMGMKEAFAALYMYQDSYVVLLNHLHKSTNNPEHLKKAIEASQKAIESASKLDLVSLIAESYWKIAKSQDSLEKYLEAAEKFPTRF